MKSKFGKIISIVTVVPILAFLTITWVYLNNSSAFNKNIIWYMVSIIFISIIPVTAYVLKRIMPNYKNGGRKEERKLAFIMAIIGYTIGLIIAFVFNAPSGTFVIFCAYFIAGVVLTFFNKVLKIKASGHACGVASSVILLLYFIGHRVRYMILLVPIVYWARVNQKRHSYTELIIGTLIGALSVVFSIMI
jgi:hypothetical protein